MKGIFDTFEASSLWYSVEADRIFLFYQASFVQLPCLEREDGHKMLLNHPNDIFELENLPEKHRYKLEFIGEF